MKAYAKHFDQLLWTEEEQLVVDLMEFNLCGDKSQTMERVGPYLRVHIKGLAEKRPSVLKGDTLRVNIRGQTQTFKGRAEKIEMEDVLLSFHESFLHSYIAGTPVEIRFILGRTPQRLFHQGCLQAKMLRPALLFPEPMDTNEGKVYPARVNFSARFCNHLIKDNDAQASAVRNVVEARAKNVPYVIFGPPGTGKTTTVVECIVQCAALDVKILVAAPTNTAADLLCTLLVKTGGEAGRGEARSEAAARQNGLAFYN
jgi:helicase MOV-10